MNQLTLRRAGDWVFFKTNNAGFINCIRRGILPLSYRKYDISNRCWLVWWERLPELVDIASRFYLVDWSELPGKWQMLIVGGEVKERRTPIKSSTPYSKLHLLDTAPPSVVKAAYKALLLEYHPDHNDGIGDKEKLNEVIDAYREVISSFDEENG